MTEIVAEPGQIPQEIWTVADRLGCLREQVVFLGGAVVASLLTDAAASSPRPTEDVDVVIEVAAHAAYWKLEERLRSLGFQHDTTFGAPICRWITGGIKVDVMPQREDILGFSNRWYSGAITHSTWNTAPSGDRIRVISPPYFIATKLAAFRGRGNGDYLGSHDIEDVITVVDGRAELAEEIASTEPDVKSYISLEFAGFLGTDDFVETLDGHLPSDAANQSRITIVLERMRTIADLSP